MTGQLTDQHRDALPFDVEQCAAEEAGPALKILAFLAKEECSKDTAMTFEVAVAPGNQFCPMKDADRGDLLGVGLLGHRRVGHPEQALRHVPAVERSQNLRGEQRHESLS